MSVTGFIVDEQIQKYDYNSLDNLPDIPESSGTFWATYNVTTETEITNAFSDNKNVMMKFGNDVFLVTRKLGIGPSGSAWLFTSVGQTNIRTTWVSGSYWNTFSTNTIGGEISYDLKQALLQLASKVAYIDEDGQTYYNDLYNALYPHELMSISATFNQGSNIIYDIDPLTVLNQYLTVVANYSDGTTETISSSDYTLSGNLLEGVSTITVYYEGFTDTFNVNVTHMAGYYTIVNNLTGCTTNNSATAIQENTTYTATITASSGYTLSGATAIITMGGNILTGVFSNGTISIPNVTGDLVITVVASAVTLSSISAVYNPDGFVVSTIETLDDLKAMLVVTAVYNNGTTEVLDAEDYVLTGDMTAGTNTYTVSYGGKTTTFTATIRQANRMLSGITWKGFGTNASTSGNVDVSFNVSSDTTSYANGALTNGPDSASYKFSQLAGHRIRIYLKNSVWDNYVDGTYLLFVSYFGVSSVQTATRHATTNWFLYPDTEDGFFDSVVPATPNDFPSGEWSLLSNVDPSAMSVDDYFGVRMYFMGGNGLKKASFSFEIYDLGAES